MSHELQQLAEWTFIMETKPPKGIEDILVDGEILECCFKTVRDVAIFTNKRLIVRDTQGMTGIKKETYSLPYKSINMYTTENAGIADINSEIELWTRIGRFKLKLKPGADIKKIDRIIATYIL